MTDKIDPTILKELIELGDRLTEDRLREIVVAELERNEMDGVAQAYAFEEADGDEKKARAYYTKHRVRRIRDLIAEEIIIAEGQRAEAAKRANEKQKEEERIAEEQRNKVRIEEMLAQGEQAISKRDKALAPIRHIFGFLGALALVFFMVFFLLLGLGWISSFGFWLE